MHSDYLKSYTKHGGSPKAMKWRNYLSAATRYRELVADLDLAGKSVLDAGCGMGDILPYLCAKTIDFSYIGVDSQKEFLEIARRRYDGYAFKEGDIFSPDFKMRADIIICCGALSHREDNWLDKRKARIANLYGLSNEVLAFNMKGGLFEPYESKNIAYANAAEILSFCAGLCPLIIYRGAYDPKDFTILMFKQPGKTD